MSATVMTVARLIAIKAVKRNMQAQGLKLAHIERQIIVSAAGKYLDEHPELRIGPQRLFSLIPNYEH